MRWVWVEYWHYASNVRRVWVEYWHYASNVSIQVKARWLLPCEASLCKHMRVFEYLKYFFFNSSMLICQGSKFYKQLVNSVALPRCILYVFTSTPKLLNKKQQQQQQATATSTTVTFILGNACIIRYWRLLKKIVWIF